MSTWQPDLTGRDGPRYLAIVDAIAQDIRAGRLTPGTRLPPHRDLAWRLKVTVGTVARAYAEAERQGLVSGEVGRGTFIKDPGNEPTLGDFLSAHAVGSGNLLDMAVNRPTGDCNAAEVAAALQEVVARSDFATILTYHLEQPSQRLRAAGAAWLQRYGVEVPAERIVITTSGQQAIIAALAAVTRPGDGVLVEEFTYPGVKSAATLLGRHLVPVRCDDSGLCPDALEHALTERHGRVIYAIPTVSNPSTVTWPEERRRVIADIARRHDALIIEDGIYDFLAPTALPPLTRFAPDRVIHITSLAKSIAPGLRIGYVGAPEGFVGRIAGGVAATTLMVPAVMAETAALMIESGAGAGCAERQFAEASERCRIATTILSEGRCLSPASFNSWLPLPPPWSAEDFVAEARKNGVCVTPGGSFAIGKPRFEAVRVSLSAVPSRDALERGLRILAGMLRVLPETSTLTV